MRRRQIMEEAPKAAFWDEIINIELFRWQNKCYVMLLEKKIVKVFVGSGSPVSADALVSGALSRFQPARVCTPQISTLPLYVFEMLDFYLLSATSNINLLLVFF